MHTDSNPLAPQVVSDVLLAFPADLTGLLPDWDTIPEEFKDARNKWQRFANHWFCLGLAETTEFWCKPGIDGAIALRHLRAILGSYQPKHEHKLAGVAYLCDLWFKKVEKYNKSEALEGT